MNTTHINSILSSNPYTQPIFKGVFSRDHFINHPIQKDEESLFVCNLDTSDESGSHWIVINKDGDNIFYFDSYGLPPLFDDLTQKIYNNCELLTWNATRLQGFNSTVCGHYCIVYCLLKARRLPFDIIISTLHDSDDLDQHTRDHIINTVVTSSYSNILSNININIHDTYKLL
jgi:hypothetical protein